LSLSDTLVDQTDSLQTSSAELARRLTEAGALLSAQELKLKAQEETIGNLIDSSIRLQDLLDQSEKTREMQAQMLASSETYLKASLERLDTAEREAARLELQARILTVVCWTLAVVTVGEAAYITAHALGALP
jgi:hypothetical protein